MEYCNGVYPDGLQCFQKRVCLRKTANKRDEPCTLEPDVEQIGRFYHCAHFLFDMSKKKFKYDKKN